MLRVFASELQVRRVAESLLSLVDRISVGRSGAPESVPRVHCHRESTFQHLVPSLTLAYSMGVKSWLAPVRSSLDRRRAYGILPIT